MGGSWSWNVSPHGQAEQHPPPKHPPPKRGSTPEAIPTELLLDNLETKLKSWSTTIKDMKETKSAEDREQLHKLMSDTERDLHLINHQIKSQQQCKGQMADDRALDEGLVQSENDKLRREIENLTTLLNDERRKTEKEEEKNTQLLMRLSKVAGQKLVENNPAIADLSDQNRPTKLGEIYSQIYDNEWTDAFEGLQDAGHSEEYTIATLYLTLVNVLDFCKRKAKTMLIKTEDAVNFLFEEYNMTEETKATQFLTMPIGKVASLKLSRQTIADFQNKDVLLHVRWRPKSGHKSGNRVVSTMMVAKSESVTNQVKTLRKQVAESMVPVVQKAYIKASWKDEQYVQALKPFIKKCIFLGWMMVVQSPPMSLHVIDKDAKFDKNIYKEYTASGPVVDFVVWPALLLQENGPVVGKGVAQGQGTST